MARDLLKRVAQQGDSHPVLEQGSFFMRIFLLRRLTFSQMDILQATLAAGIRVQKYVPSYGDQPNDVQHVVKCMLRPHRYADKD